MQPTFIITFSNLSASALFLMVSFAFCSVKPIPWNKASRSADILEERALIVLVINKLLFTNVDRITIKCNSFFCFCQFLKDFALLIHSDRNKLAVDVKVVSLQLFTFCFVRFLRKKCKSTCKYHARPFPRRPENSPGFFLWRHAFFIRK